MFSINESLPSSRLSKFEFLDLAIKDNKILELDAYFGADWNDSKNLNKRESSVLHLTADELSAISYYTVGDERTGSGDILNFKLLNTIELSDSDKACDVHLQSIFSKLANNKIISSYKGIRDNSGNVFFKAKERDIINAKKYMSTSYDRDYVFEKYGCFSYMYFWGVSGLELCNFQSYNDTKMSCEKEVLYNKNTEWRVLFEGKYGSVKKYSHRHTGHIMIVEEACINKRPLFAQSLVDLPLNKETFRK